MTGAVSKNVKYTGSGNRSAMTTLKIGVLLAYQASVPPIASRNGRWRRSSVRDLLMACACVCGTRSIRQDPNRLYPKSDAGRVHLPGDLLSDRTERIYLSRDSGHTACCADLPPLHVFGGQQVDLHSGLIELVLNVLLQLQIHVQHTCWVCCIGGKPVGDIKIIQCCLQYTIRNNYLPNDYKKSCLRSPAVNGLQIYRHTRRISERGSGK